MSSRGPVCLAVKGGITPRSRISRRIVTMWQEKENGRRRVTMWQEQGGKRSGTGSRSRIETT